MRMLTMLLLAMVGCCLTPSLHGGIPPSPDEVRDQILPSVVRIQVGPGGGTGVVARQNEDSALIVTCHHVVAGLIGTTSKATVVHVVPGGIKTIKADATLVDYDMITDVAVLRTQPVFPGVAQIATRREYTEELQPFSVGVVLGFPWVQYTGPRGPCPTPHMTVGYISDTDTEGLCRFSTPITFGNSGSPIWARFGSRWKVVSMAERLNTVDGHRSHPIFHIGLGPKIDDMLNVLERVK